MNNLSAFQAAAAELALKKMFSGPFFSICDLDKLGKLLGKNLSGPDYMALSNLHCVEWGDMSPGMRRLVKEKCIELLELSLIIEGEVIKQPQEQSQSMIRRLFGRGGE